VVAVLLAAACGTTPTAPQQQQPAQPPPPPPSFSVTATVPASGATNVSPATTVRITFSSAVANAGPGNPCTPGNIVIVPAPVSGPTACTILPGGNAVELTGLVLNSSTTYTVTVQPQVSSSTGVQLGGTGYSFSFTTRFWTAPPTTVNAVLLQVGYVCSNGEVNVLGPFTWVGEDESDTLCPGAGDQAVRGFQAFGSPANLAGAVVISSTYTGEKVWTGNPYAALGGALLAEPVSWLVQVTPGVLDAADYAAPALGNVTVVAASGLSFFAFSFNAVDIVRQQTALPNIGIRFRFASPGNNDGNDDLEEIGPDPGFPLTVPSLQITYAVP
jgi:hypothetical protein